MNPVLNRRIFLASGSAVFASLSGPVRATEFPNHPVKLVVPFPPGAGTDATARIVAERLGEVLNQTVIVDNVAGANGLVGTKAVARAAPDGYTLGIAAPGPMAIAQFMFADMQYDPEKDFVPVIKVNEAKIGLVIAKHVPATTLQDLLTLIRAQPGKFNAGNATVGSVHHLVAEMLKQHEKLDFTLVNYKGGAGAMNDLVGGHVDMMFVGLSTIVPQVKDGVIKPLMVVGETRSALLPDVPCSGELGLPYLIGTQWHGIVVPKGTAAPLVALFHDALLKVLTSPDVMQKLAQIGTEVTTGSSTEFADFMRAERDRWGPVIRDANIKVD